MCQTPGGRLIEATTIEELSWEWPKGGHLTVVLFAIVFCNCLLTDYWLLKIGWPLNGGSTVCFGQEPFKKLKSCRYSYSSYSCYYEYYDYDYNYDYDYLTPPLLLNPSTG